MAVDYIIPGNVAVAREFDIPACPSVVSKPGLSLAVIVDVAIVISIFDGPVELVMRDVGIIHVMVTVTVARPAVVWVGGGGNSDQSDAN